MARRTRSEKGKVKRALDGIRVIDLTQMANGPYTTLILGLLGAEIIKIEPPTGQMLRKTFAVNPNVDSKTFIQLNHGKKSVTLNLKTEMGKEIFKGLVREADVVVEDFSLGTMERLGLGYDDLKEVNPKIIFASTKGYGRSGPYKDLPAYDAVVQAMSGAMSVNGYPGNPPCKVGPAIGDWATSVFTALGVVSALRLRDMTGVGRIIETSQQEATVSFTEDWQQMYLESGIVPGRKGNAPYSYSTSGKNVKAMYPTKDGYVYLLPLMERDWEPALRVMGREDLIGDPRFADPIKRCDNAEAIDAIIEGWTKDKTRDEIMNLLSAAEVTCGKVLDIKEVMEDPHLKERRFFVDINHPKAGKVKVFGLPLKFSDSPTEPQASSPLLGEHNENIYGGVLGYSREELAALKAQGVI